MGCYPTRSACLCPADPGQSCLWAAQEKELDLQAFTFAPQLADERQRPPVNPEMPAIMLNVADLLERPAVECQHARPEITLGVEQAEAPVIQNHFRMHSGYAGGVDQRKARLGCRRHTDEFQCWRGIENKIRRSPASLGLGPFGIYDGLPVRMRSVRRLPWCVIGGRGEAL